MVIKGINQPHDMRYGIHQSTTLNDECRVRKCSGTQGHSTEYHDTPRNTMMINYGDAEGGLAGTDSFLQECPMFTCSEPSSGRPSQHRPSHPNIHPTSITATWGRVGEVGDRSPKGEYGTHRERSVPLEMKKGRGGRKMKGRKIRGRCRRKPGRIRRGDDDEDDHEG